MEHIYMCFRFKLQNTLTEYTRIISSSSKMLSKPPSSRVHSEFEWIPANYLQFFVTLHFNTLSLRPSVGFLHPTEYDYYSLKQLTTSFPLFVNQLLPLILINTPLVNSITFCLRKFGFFRFVVSLYICNIGHSSFHKF